MLGTSELGLSPRARGAVLVTVDAGHGEGTIRAGCGEQETCRDMCRVRSGPSPRARGAGLGVLPEDLALGAIPAGAGSRGWR